MSKSAVRWAIAIALAQTLSAGCRHDAPPPAAPSGAAGGPALLPLALEAPPSEPTFAEPPPREGSTPDLDGLAVRIAPELVPGVSPEQPSRGPASAPVTLQIFSDFECPFCARAVPVLAELEAKLGPTLRIVWRNFPLPMHEHARLAAAAGVEVYSTRGGAAFWRFHDAIFEAASSGLDESAIERVASREGVTAARLRRLAATSEHDARIDQDVLAGDRAGVQGTPAFLINDWLVVGVVPAAELEAVVARALAERR